MQSEKVGELITKLRKDKRLTQTELADLLGVTDKAVSRWERGDGFPEITITPKLASILGISIDELLSGEKKEKPMIASDKHISKYKVLYLIEIIIVAFGYMLGVILQYTIGAFWPLAVFSSSFAFVGLITHLIFRINLIGKITYNDTEKSMIRKCDIAMVFLIFSVLMATLPMYVIPRYVTTNFPVIGYTIRVLPNVLEYLANTISFVCIGVPMYKVISIVYDKINKYKNNHKSAVFIFIAWGIVLLSLFYSLWVHNSIISNQVIHKPIPMLASISVYSIVTTLVYLAFFIFSLAKKKINWMVLPIVLIAISCQLSSILGMFQTEFLIIVAFSVIATGIVISSLLMINKKRRNEFSNTLVLLVHVLLLSIVASNIHKVTDETFVIILLAPALLIAIDTIYIDCKFH